MRSFSLIFKQFSRSVLLVACFAFLGTQAHAQGDAAKGEALFKSKCTACHKVESEVVGPALGKLVTEETDDKYLTKWIQNNQALIAAKNPKAVAIFNQYQQKNMTIFADLSDGDVANILAYIRADWKAKSAAPAPGTATGAPAEEKGPSKMLIFSLLGVIVIAFIIILVLNRVIATLERMLVKNQGALIVETAEGEAVKQVDKLAWLKKLARNKKFAFFDL